MPNIHFPLVNLMPDTEFAAFRQFLQDMADRRAQGGQRYGRINQRHRYMTRLRKELAAYERTGNAEQLLNIAVYAFLESYAPENRNFHFDPTAVSVTRAGS